MKPIWDKYPTPENLLDSVYTPTMNEEIQTLFEKWQENNDEKHCGIQKSLIRCLTATLQLNGIIADSNIEDAKKTESLQTCIDVTAMTSQLSREMSLKRRGFAKSHLHADFKELCSKSRPITKFLFGGNVAEEMKQLKLTKQLSVDKPLHRNYQGRFPHGGRGHQYNSNHILPQGRGRQNQGY